MVVQRRLCLLSARRDLGDRTNRQGRERKPLYRQLLTIGNGTRKQNAVFQLHRVARGIHHDDHGLISFTDRY